MERLKQTLKKYFCLSPGWTVLIAIPSFALVIFVFAANLKDTVFAPVVYLAYVASAYGAIVVVTGFAGIVRAVRCTVINHPLTKWIESTSLGGRYMSDVMFRTKVSLYLGLAINLAYVAINLFYGISYGSAWFIMLAAYFGLLAVMRFLLLHRVDSTATKRDLTAELRKYRSCGILLLPMNVALSVIVVLIVYQNRGYDYPGLQIYLMALYAFYAVITATINLITFRKHGSPMLSAAKVVNLTAALVSMLSLETAMLAQFGAEDSQAFRQTMTGTTGAAVCAIVFGMAMFMIIRATKQLKQQQNNISQTKP